jgi:hypothetical protein
MGLGCQPNTQPPTWRTRVSLLVRNLTLDLSGLGDPVGSYATAGIALEIIGTHKPHRHKAGTTGGRQQLIRSKNVERRGRVVLTLLLRTREVRGSNLDL